ncbi:MAG: M23 family metallopeptidase [Cyclobacteriaceae bacterium]
MMFSKLSAFLIAIILFSSCSEEKVPERYYPRNDHDAYRHSLEQANLLNTALGEDWLKASKKPFENQIKVQLPYQEAFVLEDLKPDALGYRFEAKRGQKILIDIGLIVQDTTRVFIDLFRIENDSLNLFRQVASADSSFRLAFEPRRNASYLLRLQPELLRGGDFSITIENVPTLGFPVAGKNKRAIHSVFGDPRDGGKRDHHGVDIFAKRHTPILAPIEAEVRFVGTRGLGGKVVWLYDRKTGNNLYFAHLQEQLVKRWDKVSPGDTIGTVGNTGNARYTPPHLHFGIYRNGPVDPYPFIVPEYPRATIFEPDTFLLGKHLELAKKTFLKSEMRWKSQNLDTLELKDQVEIMAVNHRYVRVRTNDGTLGFLRKRDLPKVIQSSSASD